MDISSITDLEPNGIDKELLFILKRIETHAKKKFPDQKDEALLNSYIEGARMALELVSVIRFLN